MDHKAALARIAELEAGILRLARLMGDDESVTAPPLQPLVDHVAWLVGSLEKNRERVMLLEGKLEQMRDAYAEFINDTREAAEETEKMLAAMESETLAGVDEALEQSGDPDL